MKNLRLFTAVLAMMLALGLTSCGDILGQGTGNNNQGGNNQGGNGGSGEARTLTITDIPAAYNGKYIFFQGTFAGGSMGDPSSVVFGGQNVTFTFTSSELGYWTFTGSQISNGRAVLPMWRVQSSTGQQVTFTGYTGSNTTDSSYSMATIVDSSVWHDYEQSTGVRAAIQFPPITFTNGSATASVNNGFLQGN